MHNSVETGVDNFVFDVDNVNFVNKFLHYSTQYSINFLFRTVKGVEFWKIYTSYPLKPHKLTTKCLKLTTGKFKLYTAIWQVSRAYVQT